MLSFCRATGMYFGTFYYYANTHPVVNSILYLNYDFRIDQLHPQGFAGISRYVHGLLRGDESVHLAQNPNRWGV
jgi:hypothetical protein